MGWNFAGERWRREARSGGYGWSSSSPASPQNAFIESFNGRLREECLNANWFLSLAGARRKIAAWRKDYNEQRPHSSLGYLPPSQFAQAAEEMRHESGFCSDEQGKRASNAGPLALHPIPRSLSLKAALAMFWARLGSLNAVGGGEAGPDA